MKLALSYIADYALTMICGADFGAVVGYVLSGKVPALEAQRKCICTPIGSRRVPLLVLCSYYVLTVQFTFTLVTFS